MAAIDLTAARLRELLTYDPETGVFRSRIDRVGKGCKTKTGDVVGGPHNRGYWSIRLADGRFLAHRLAWLYMTGEWPKNAIDHINGSKSDNRWTNLRDVSQSANMQNLKGPMGASRSGLLGVAWHARDRKWIAQINAHGIHHYIGSFADKADASAAYLAAKARLHVPVP